MDIQLDSAQRDNGTSENYVKIIDWAQHIGTPPPPQGYEIILKNATIPYTFYGIDETNNVVVWEDSVGGFYSLTIPVGTYQASDFAGYLAASMSTISGDTYTCTFDSTDGKLSWTKTTGAGTWQFVESGGGSTFTAQEATGLLTSSLTGGSGFIANGVEYISDCVVNMMHITRVYVHVGWPGVRTYDSRVNQWNNVMAVLTPTGVWGDILELSPENPTRFKSHTLPEQVPVFLTDHEGNVINLRCSEWMMTLTIYGLGGVTLSSEEMRIVEPDRARNAASRVVAAPPQEVRGSYNAPARTDYGVRATGLLDYSHGILNTRR